MKGPTPPSRPVPPVVPGTEKQQSSGTDGAQHAIGKENTDRQMGTTPAKADAGAAAGSVTAPKQTVNKGAPEFKTTIVEKTTPPGEGDGADARQHSFAEKLTAFRWQIPAQTLPVGTRRQPIRVWLRQ